MRFCIEEDKNFFNIKNKGIIKNKIDNILKENRARDFIEYYNNNCNNDFEIFIHDVCTNRELYDVLKDGGFNVIYILYQTDMQYNGNDDWQEENHYIEVKAFINNEEKISTSSYSMIDDEESWEDNDGIGIFNKKQYITEIDNFVNKNIDDIDFIMNIYNNEDFTM